MSILINSYNYAPVGGGFAPDDAAGLWMWLKADAIVGLNDGDRVVTWADSGSGGHNAFNTTFGPTYKTNIVNGLPVTRWDGATNYLDVEDTSALTSGEVFFVLKLDNDPPTTGGGGLWRVGTHSDSQHVPFTDGTIYDGWGSTVRKTTVNPTPSMASWRVYSVYSAANDWANYLDGVQLYSTATNTVAFAAGSGLGLGGSTFFDGDIAEVIMYDNKLSTEDRESVIQYLSHKYDLGL